jgi:ABC-type branched-subunit amino acid transport system ATPase component
VNDAPSFHAEVRGVSKRFGGVQALTDIDLGIVQGSIHALVGENGAGKSTLGKIIAGVHRPDDGELWVNGRKVSYRSARDALADGVTLIAQEPTLVPHRSVLENVFLGFEDTVAGVLEKRTLARRYEELIAATGIELPARKLARTLRVADQQKVEILRAVAREARFVIMDEPTSALTRDEADRLFELVRGLRRSGTTIVYVSHFLAEVLALADTVSVLRDGRLIKTSAADGETPDRPRVPGQGAAACRRAGDALRSRPDEPAHRRRGVVRHPRRRDRRARRADRQRPLRGRPRDLRSRRPAQRNRRSCGAADASPLAASGDQQGHRDAARGPQGPGAPDAPLDPRQRDPASPRRGLGRGRPPAPAGDLARQ